MKNLIVNKNYDKKKLSKFVMDNIPNLSFGVFCNLLRKKDIKVNGKRINKDILVSENDEISIYITDEFLNNLNNKLSNSKLPFELNIFYEDDNILIIDKPINLEVTGENSLTDFISKNSKFSNSSFKPQPCHRLDRNTSGLVLFAKNELALSILLEKFKNHEIEKHYIAHVYGVPSSNLDKGIAYLFKDSKKSRVYISNTPKPGYSKIITSFSVIEKYANNSCLLDVSIETGKTHQIRAHLAFLGYPIIGDGKYGQNSINKKFNKKTQELCSYLLKFNFSSDASILNYLNNKCFKLNISQKKDTI